MTIEVNLQVQLVNNLKEATLTKKTKRDIHAIAKKYLLLGLQFLYICAETRELVIVNATSKTKKKTDVNNYKLTAVTMHIIVYLLSGTLPEGIMYALQPWITRRVFTEDKHRQWWRYCVEEKHVRFFVLFGKRR